MSRHLPHAHPLPAERRALIAWILDAQVQEKWHTLSITKDQHLPCCDSRASLYSWSAAPPAYAACARTVEWARSRASMGCHARVRSTGEQRVSLRSCLHACNALVSCCEESPTALAASPRKLHPLRLRARFVHPQADLLPQPGCHDSGAAAGYYHYFAAAEQNDALRPITQLWYEPASQSSSAASSRSTRCSTPKCQSGGSSAPGSRSAVPLQSPDYPDQIGILRIA